MVIAANPSGGLGNDPVDWGGRVSNVHLANRHNNDALIILYSLLLAHTTICRTYSTY